MNATSDIDESPSQVDRTSAEILAGHSSSFRLAARLLAPEQRRDATLLYAVCRLIDDIADEQRDRQTAARRLAHLRAELRQQARPRALIDQFLQMARRRKLDLEYLFELITGVESDLGEVRIGSDDELLRYCYRVAGTVGLMMCAVLDVDDPAASPHAIDLGVAMQLTNICRDVLEDARRGRVYLPKPRLEKVDLSPQDVLRKDVDEPALARVIDDLLDMADDYYRSADEGMQYIPSRARLAIVVASRIYRAYGVCLKRRGSNPLAGPPRVSRFTTAYSTGVAVGQWIRFGLPTGPPSNHCHRLHAPLRDLPGVTA